LGLALDEPRQEETIYSDPDFDLLADAAMVSQLKSMGGASIDIKYGNLQITTGQGCC
jgi:hypothetical protein